MNAENSVASTANERLDRADLDKLVGGRLTEGEMQKILAGYGGQLPAGFRFRKISAEDGSSGASTQSRSQESARSSEGVRAYEDAIARMAVERAGVYAEDVSRAKELIKSMPRWKRAAMYTAMGAIAATGVGVASLAIPALGIAGAGAALGSLTWGQIAGVFAVKAVGGFVGHKVGKKLVAGGDHKLELMKIASAHDKAMRALRRGYHNDENLRKAIDKGYRRANWMPSIASALITLGAGAGYHLGDDLWSLLSGGATDGSVSGGDPFSYGHGAPAEAPTAPPAPAPAAPPAPAPAAPPAPAPASTPAEVLTCPSEPLPFRFFIEVPPPNISDNVFEFTVTPWDERIVGDALSTSDGYDSAVTLTEGARDVIQKASDVLGADISDHDALRLADLLNHYLGADGNMNGGLSGHALEGARSALDSAGINDPDLVIDYETYSLRGIFADKTFMDNFIEKITTSTGFDDKRAVVGFLEKLCDTVKS